MILHLAVLLSSRPTASALSTFRIDESRINQNESDDILIIPPSRQQSSLSIKPTFERPLSELLDHLTRDNAPADFHKRLLEEEEQQRRSSLVSRSTSLPVVDAYFLLKVAAVGVILILAANLLQGGSLVALWKEFLDISVIVGLLRLPFLWIRPSYLLGDSLSFVKFFGRKDLLVYIKESFWTTMKITLTQIIVSELWGQFWKLTSKKMRSVFGTTTQDLSSAPVQSYAPEWLVGGYSFIASTVEKGCTKLVQKVMQKHLQKSITTLSSSAMLCLRDALFPVSMSDAGAEE